MDQPNLTRYRILDLIGAGGMGEVYLAEDQKLGRKVAVKVIPEQILADEATRARFRKEALTLSRLNHPNIATVYDFDTEDGVDFLVMEFVPGQTLDERLQEGPLDLDGVVDLGKQLADGLTAAHAEGVVHRDLKPGNLRVTPDGRLKILDFGLARFMPQADATDVSVSLADGMSGTLPYMAPEQIRHETVDERTDIHAAGAVLYELATGQRPFAGAYPAALMYSILNEPPDSPGAINDRIPPPLESVILKALEKDPRHRFRSAEQLGGDLERARQGETVTARPRPSRSSRRRWFYGLAAAAATALAIVIGGIGSRLLPSGPAAPSIAVLPCVDLSDNGGGDFFADGMTDDFITQLQGFAGFDRVINTTTMLTYRGSDRTPREIAEELGVDVVLSPRLRRDGDLLHLSTQLIDPRTDEILWGDQFTRGLHEIYSLESEIARKVAESLQLSMSGDERSLLDGAKNVDPRAYRAFLRGKELRRAPGTAAEGWKQNEQRALEFFAEAVAIDSTYALALMELSEVSWRMGGSGYLPVDPTEREQVRRRRRSFADSTRARAIAMDPLLADLYPRKWDRDAFRRAMELRPNDAWGYYWHANWLRINGFFAESQRIHERALELDPGNLRFQSVYAQIFFYQRDFARSEKLCRDILEIVPHEFNALHFLWWNLMEQKRYLEAEAPMLQFLSIRYPELADRMQPFALLIQNMAGTVSTDERSWQIVEGIYRQFGGQGAAYFAIHLGDRERTLRYLSDAWSGPEPRTWENLPAAPSTVAMPIWDPVREDPRFIELARNVREAWRTCSDCWN